jgi:hypothetical protein
MKKVVISLTGGILLVMLMRYLENKIKGAYKYFTPIG